MLLIAFIIIKNISFACFEQPVGEGANLFRKGSRVPGSFKF